MRILNCVKRFGFPVRRTQTRFAGFERILRPGPTASGILRREQLRTISVKVEKNTDWVPITECMRTITILEGFEPDARQSPDEYYLNNIRSRSRQGSSKTRERQDRMACRICGYEYVGAELRKIYRPAVQAPASDFEKGSFYKMTVHYCRPVLRSWLAGKVQYWDCPLAGSPHNK